MKTPTAVTSYFKPVVTVHYKRHKLKSVCQFTLKTMPNLFSILQENYKSHFTCKRKYKTYNFLSGLGGSNVWLDMVINDVAWSIFEPTTLCFLSECAAHRFIPTLFFGGLFDRKFSISWSTTFKRQEPSAYPVFITFIIERLLDVHCSIIIVLSLSSY